MKTYKHIFFDFDNTLWDFRHNSKESLKDIYKQYGLQNYFKDFEDFHVKFEENNNTLWKDYREGLISKDTLGIRRFLTILDKADYPDCNKIFQKINSDYISLTTTKTKIIEDAYSLLGYLKKKNKYQLHILTDGFFEIQVVKLRTSKLSHFISDIVTAEEVGYLKPNVELFEYALKQANAKKEESVMIGDCYETDIIGAYNAGIDQIFLNHDNKKELEITPTYQVYKLKEIKNIL